LRQWIPGLAAAMLWALPLSAQLPEIGAPRGVLRLEIGGTFANANDQFVDGTTAPWRNQFSSAAIGTAFYPGLAPTQSLVAELSGNGSYALNVGGAVMKAQVSVGTLQLGATLGVSGRLSLFGMVPIVRQGININYGFDGSGANVGFNPADPAFGTSQGATATALFLGEFGEALDTLGTRLAAGYYDGDPTEKALAEATLLGGTAYLARLDSLFVVPGSAGSFVPLASSSAGQAIAGTVTATQGTLTALGIPSFTQPVPLPTDALTPGDYDQYLTATNGSIAAAPIANYASFLLGDVELGASYTLIDRWNRPDQPGGLRVVAQGLIRLPTGTQPLPNDFTSLPTGSGQTDLQLAVVADVGGGKIGARFTGSYTNQLSATVTGRVTLPSQPIPWRNRLATVDRDPGNEFALGASPYFQLAPGFAIVGIVRYWSRGSDAVSYATAADSISGVSATELEEGTERTALSLGGGLSYAPPSVVGRVPLDAFWTYEAVVSATGGTVPKAGTIRMGLRVPMRLWGRIGP